MSAIVPIPRMPVSVRPATMDDLLFIDGLQKQHSRQLGHFSIKWFEAYINTGGVLVAESSGQRVGYVISCDRYQKRDELGVIYQLCVAPGEQRKLIGAALIQAVFERSAYGCKLYCCWCAQDIEANRFWESLGFVPIAFRAGSRAKDRVHIFWQRRIRPEDTTTPYWFPAQTNAGAIREDRLVLPIPPGKKWSDEMPRLLPDQKPELTNGGQKLARRPEQGPLVPRRRFVQFGPPTMQPAAKPQTVLVGAKPERAKKPKAKNDPKLVAAARELRDRYLEHVNSGQVVLESTGKYEVTRALAAPATPSDPLRQLPHAA